MHQRSPYFAPLPAAVRVLAVVLLAAFMLPASPFSAKAHAVHIFAWPEGENICTESYFSKKSKVRGGEVRMEDASGALLQSARTDDAGAVCFPAPEKPAELRFVVLAGEGHRGEFTLPAASAALAASGATATNGGADRSTDGEAEKAASLSSAGKNGTFAGPTAGESGAGQPAESALGTEIRAIVREELRREIAPLAKALAASARDDGPSLRDVLAGLGWIVGLTGLAAAYASRKKRG
jgi:nickel transport protein